MGMDGNGGCWDDYYDYVFWIIPENSLRLAPVRKKDKHVNLIQPPEKLNGGIPQTFWNVRMRFVVSLRIWRENVELWSDGPGVRKPSKAPGGSGSEVQKMYGCLWSLDRW